ncbi:MAG: GerMN domain-containing protein [Thermoleophilia bacterium]
MRRTVPGSARPRPRAVLAAVLVTLVAALAACGAEPEPTATVTVTATPPASAGATGTPVATPAPPTTLSLYFLRGEKLGVAERRVPSTTMPATAALKALFEGPSPAEATAGLSSQVPPGTKLRALRIEGGVATVDLSARFAAGGGSLSLTARVAEVVYTLTQFPTVKAVDFRLEGAAVLALGGEGLILEAGQRRADWREFEPLIFVEKPGVGAVLSSPFVLSGTASVFEGAFIARLVGGGSRLADVPVQATRGAPGRGRFRETIAFDTTSASGTVVVFDQSMEDGSRQDEVRIPVTFAQ